MLFKKTGISLMQPSMIFSLLYVNSSCEIMEMHLGFVAVVPAQGALLLIHINTGIMFISRLHGIKCFNYMINYVIF